jgi:hypothetical protein
MALHPDLIVDAARQDYRVASRLRCTPQGAPQRNASNSFLIVFFAH